jgi:hypothetical protein
MGSGGEMTTQMTIKPFLLLGICLLLAFPCELRANQLKQPGLVDATVETTITEVEKLFIKYPELAIQIRSNMVSVAHNPKVFDGMVKRLKDLSRTPTFLDSAYTLKALHDIIKLTEPEEKAASAAGTAVGYLGNVVGNVAVATKMAGSSGILTLGGGFLPGLVVSLSAKAVTEMTTEAIMLYYDRQNAAFKERWAEIELRENAIRGLLRVNDLLKAGKLDEAQTYLTRIQKYLINNSFPKDGIFDQIDRLSGLITKAEDKAWANRIIAEARVSFQQAYRWAVLGRNLSTAKRLVQEAITVLQSGVSRVPELQANIDKCERLHAYIDGLIAEAPPLGAVSVSGPDQVAAGESCEFELRVTGGLPDYHPIDMNGYAHATGATVYWEAPADPGEKTLTFRIRDDKGQTAEAVKSVEVLAGNEEPEDEAPSNEEDAKFLHLGQAGRTDLFEITVTAVAKASYWTKEKKEDEEYVVVSIRVVNISNEENSIGANDFQWVDSQGYRNGIEDYSGVKTNESIPAIFGAQWLSPGESFEGSMVYLMPKNMNRIEFHYIKGYTLKPDLQFLFHK